MPQSAVVLCDDPRSLQILQSALKELAIEHVICSSQHDALEPIIAGRCSALIADFDLPRAEEVIRMAALLPDAQKPALLALGRRAWPGTGGAFKSGASRILYKPLDSGQLPDQLKDALKTNKRSAKPNRRRALRHELKTLVYLDLESGTIPGVSINIDGHGLALQATEPVPMASNFPFRCVLPGTTFTLQGYADVIWASEEGRAGLFFSKLTPAAQKQLKLWLKKHGTENDDSGAVRELLPPEDADVTFAVSTVET